MDCTELNCGRPAFARGVCRKHYNEQRIREAQPCTVPQCNKPGTRSGGLCEKHYREELSRQAETCSIPGCSHAVKAKGLCDKHYQRDWKHGSPVSTRPSDWGAREAHPMYKIYIWHKRGRPKSMCDEWANDFWAFVDTVGDKLEGYTLRKRDRDFPLGPTNWEWKQSTPSADKAVYAKVWRGKNKRASKSIDLKKMYGITMDQYEAMEAAQGGVCAICNDPPGGRYKNLAVDHCHSTGKVRGLLCGSCNRALGFFRDDTDAIQRAVEYLIRNRLD
jgi:hypothetical protein